MLEAFYGQVNVTTKRSFAVIALTNVCWLTAPPVFYSLKVLNIDKYLVNT